MTAAWSHYLVQPLLPKGLAKAAKLANLGVHKKDVTGNPNSTPTTQRAVLKKLLKVKQHRIQILNRF